MKTASSVPNASTAAIVRRVIMEHGRAHLRSYLVVFVFMAIVAACTSLAALLMKTLFNTAVGSEPTSSALYYPLLISALFIVKGLFSYLQEVSAARIGARIVGEIQRKCYAHLLRMDISFFQSHSSSMLITSVTNGAQAVRDVINLTVVTLGRDLLTVFGLCLVMMVQDPVLFVIVLAVSPLAALLLRRLSASAKKATQTEVVGMAGILALTRETVQGIRMLKSFQLEGLLQERVGEATMATELQRNRLARVKASVAPISEVLSGLAIGAVILYATFRSQGEPGGIGSVFSFITALLLAGEPLRRLSRLHIDLATASERVSMLYKIFDQPEVEPVKDDRPSLIVKRGEIAFRNVTFHYPGSKNPVLRDFSITFPGGKFIALVGTSGGGKTTILSLIQRFFQPDSGFIEIDGVPINEVSLNSLRRNVSYLDQEAFLFEGTIEDNIIGSCIERDPVRLTRAAQLSSADSFIGSMKHGYQTTLRELSSNLSGGQRQRIAIARAFYKDAPILLLDEPTSALDTDNEQQIRRSIRALAHGRTTVMVAHRLSTVRGADLIYVIDNGKVVESGTHEGLLARNGVYAGLCLGQSKEEELIEKREAV